MQSCGHRAWVVCFRSIESIPATTKMISNAYFDNTKYRSITLVGAMLILGSCTTAQQDVEVPPTFGASQCIARYNHTPTGQQEDSWDYWRCLEEFAQSHFSAHHIDSQKCTLGRTNSLDKVIHEAEYNHSGFSIVLLSTQTRADSLLRSAMKTSGMETKSWDWCACDRDCDIIGLDANDGLRCHCPLANTHCTAVSASLVCSSCPPVL